MSVWQTRLSIQMAVTLTLRWADLEAQRSAGKGEDHRLHSLDPAMNRVYDLVSRKLSDDPIMRKLTEESERYVEEGEASKPSSDRTRRWLKLALEEAAEQDPGFAEALDREMLWLMWS